MKNSLLVLVGFLAYVSMTSQTPCECSLLDRDRATTFYLDTCGLSIPGSTCEEKSYISLFPHPRGESFYGAVRSQVGWGLITDNHSDWFEGARRNDGRPPRDTLAFEQIDTTKYLEIRDSLRTIFSEFGVQAMIRIASGPYGPDTVSAFFYEFRLDKHVQALEFIKRLQRWVANDTRTAGFEVYTSGDLVRSTPASVDNGTFFETQFDMTVIASELLLNNRSSEAIGSEVTNLRGEVVYAFSLPIGESRIDISRLPTGMYFLRLGTSVRRFVKM